MSILIPAYRAEAFIDRTLRFARGQTHQACRILVSVDHAADHTPDDTAGRVRRHREDDPRIQLIEQSERQGWAGNVNALLERVETPYFFLYMHDDIIVPQYTERLLARLLAAPRAASIHADMAHFGASDHVSRAVPFLEDSAAARLLRFFLAPERGSPLRSLIRTSAVGRLRLPLDAPGGLWANEPFLARLLAAGPALALHEELYLRWQLRPGGLTDGWRDMDPETAFQGTRANIRHMLAIATEAVAPGPERQAVLAAVLLHQLPRLQAAEAAAGRPLFASLGELDPRLLEVADEQAPPWQLATLPSETPGWAWEAVTRTGTDPRLGVLGSVTAP